MVKNMFIQIKNKKGVSPIIGYVLLVAFVIILGVIAYNWMKTYVPQEDLECPDGTSLFVRDYSCDNNTLNLTLKNNGKFNIGGYFIYVTTLPGQELATKDLSQYLDDNISRLSPTGVKLTGEMNSLKPTQEEVETYDISNANFSIYSVEIVPIRWQKENRINRIVSCTTSKVSENIVC